MNDCCIIDLLRDDDEDNNDDSRNSKEGDDIMEDIQNGSNRTNWSNNKSTGGVGSPTDDEDSQDSPLYGFSDRNFRSLIQPCETGHEDEFASLSLVYLTLTHIFNASSAGVLIVPPLYTIVKLQLGISTIIHTVVMNYYHSIYP